MKHAKKKKVNNSINPTKDKRRRKNGVTMEKLYIWSVCTFMAGTIDTRAKLLTASESGGRSSRGTLALDQMRIGNRSVSGNTRKSGSPDQLRGGKGKKNTKKRGKQEPPTGADFNFSYRRGEERKRTKRRKRGTRKGRKRREGKKEKEEDFPERRKRVNLIPSIQ